MHSNDSLLHSEMNGRSCFSFSGCSVAERLETSGRPGTQAFRRSGALQGPVFRAATWNVSSAFVRWQELSELAANFDLVVLEEANIGRASAYYLACSARRLGFMYTYQSAYLQHGATQSAWISLWTRVPSQRIRLRLVSDPLEDRHIAVLVHRPGSAPLLAVGCYGHASDTRRRHIFLDDLLRSSLAFGLDTLFLGDWNQPAEDFATAPLLARGSLWSLDDCFEGHPFATSSGGRALDYALATLHMVPSSRQQFATTSDHQLVVYGFPWFANTTPEYTMPHRRPFAPEVPAARFVALQARLSRVDWSSLSVEQSWTVLSDYAEDALCDPGAGVRRSAAWQPVRQRTVHRCSPCSQSVRLRQLLRLRRRLSH